MFSVTVDQARRIVIAEVAGFFDEEEATSFAKAEQAAAASLNGHSGEFGLLLLAQEGVVQSQAVIALFQQLLTDLPVKAARIAIVCQGALLTLQMRRVMTAERTGVFEDVGKATAWICAGLSSRAEP